MVAIEIVDYRSVAMHVSVDKGERQAYARQSRRDEEKGEDGGVEQKRERAFAIAINTKKTIGAMQWIFGKPSVVHTNPKKPIGPSGIAIRVRSSQYIFVACSKESLLTAQQPPLGSHCVPWGSLPCVLRSLMIGGV